LLPGGINTSHQIFKYKTKDPILASMEGGDWLKVVGFRLGWSPQEILWVMRLGCEKVGLEVLI
jgi:hypothetical protein